MIGDRDIDAAFVIAKAVQRRHKPAGVSARAFDESEGSDRRAFPQAREI
jgi:hypothetical protein